MLGNALGWALSIILVLATVGSLSYIDRSTRPTPPDAFGLDPAHAAPLKLPDLGAIVPQASDRADEAASLYAQALAVVAQNRDAFDAFIRADAAETPEPVARANQLLLSATALAGGSIFSQHPAVLIHYKSSTPELDDAIRLGKSALRGGAIVRRTNPAAGLSLLRAALALGHRLADERITYAELNAGLELLAESAAGMKQLLRETNVSAALAGVEAFDAERLALVKSVILPIASRIRTLDGRVISQNLGNVRRWATSDDADQVWRVEAILALGRARFGVGPTGQLGDQRAANRLLAELSSHTNPRVQTAARAGMQLTLEQFRQLR